MYDSGPLLTDGKLLRECNKIGRGDFSILVYVRCYAGHLQLSFEKHRDPTIEQA